MPLSPLVATPSPVATSVVLALRSHPSLPAMAGVGIEVSVRAEAPGMLALDYRLSDPNDGVRLPPPGAGGRADGLWRHTCFEAFVQVEGEAGYREFNLSPSGQWQAYRFTAYRRGEPLLVASPPQLDWGRAPGGGSLCARLPAAALPPPGAWRLGLCAVLEGVDGQLTYWALSHPGKRPDFHDPRGFTLPWQASGPC